MKVPSAVLAVLFLTGLVVPAAAVDAAQIERGRKAFIANGCGWCHDDGGKKAGRCPQLMNDAKSDDQLTARIATGSPGRMPAFGTALPPDDLKAIVVYIRSLKP